MLLLHCSPARLLLRRLSPSPRLAAAPFTLSARRRVRRTTAIRAEPEPSQPSAAGTSEPDGEEGPVELRAPTLFSVDDNPTPLQTATSVLLTGAVSVFLFRSLRRRARRAKELRVRSSGVQKKPNNLTEEALETLRLVSASPVETEKPPSPVQTLLGGIAAGGHRGHPLQVHHHHRGLAQPADNLRELLGQLLKIFFVYRVILSFQS